MRLALRQKLTFFEEKSAFHALYQHFYVLLQPQQFNDMKPLQSIVSTVLILVACSAHAQFNIVRNFASELTGGGTQNWNVMQDD